LSNFSFGELEAQVHQQAEAIADRFPILHLGMSTAEAMRQAKLSQIPIFSHPFYWSPFILIGDAGK
jgi:CHAT domain-containing protein